MNDNASTYDVIRIRCTRESKCYFEFANRMKLACGPIRENNQRFRLEHCAYSHETMRSDGVFGFFQWQQCFGHEELIKAYRLHGYIKTAENLERIIEIIQKKNQGVTMHEIAISYKDGNKKFPFKEIDPYWDKIRDEWKINGYKNGDEIFNCDPV